MHTLTLVWTRTERQHDAEKGVKLFEIHKSGRERESRPKPGNEKKRGGRGGQKNQKSKILKYDLRWQLFVCHARQREALRVSPRPRGEVRCLSPRSLNERPSTHMKGEKCG